MWSQSAEEGIGCPCSLLCLIFCLLKELFLLLLTLLKPFSSLHHLSALGHLSVGFSCCHWSCSFLPLLFCVLLASSPLVAAYVCPGDACQVCFVCVQLSRGQTENHFVYQRFQNATEFTSCFKKNRKN